VDLKHRTLYTGFAAHHELTKANLVNFPFNSIERLKGIFTFNQRIESTQPIVMVALVKSHCKFAYSLNTLMPHIIISTYFSQYALSFPNTLLKSDGHNFLFRIRICFIIIMRNYNPKSLIHFLFCLN